MAKRSKVDEYIEKYYLSGELIPQDLYESDKRVREEVKSLEYRLFKQRNPTLFSRLVKFGSSTIGKFIKFNINEEQERKVNTLIYLIGGDYDARELYGFSIFVLFIGIIIGIPLLIIGQFLIGIAVIFVGIILTPMIQGYPKRELSIRMSKASSELVTFILYLVISMRQTSNLETAVQFASDNLTSYLAFDLKKLLWDTAARKYKNIKEALDDYSQRWEKTNPAFTDAIFLVESSLYQRDEETRNELLDEASNRILTGTLEMMNNYASTLKEPLNMIYMLGMVLPVLGLVLAPMLMAFIQLPDFGPLLFIGYDILLPLMVYLLIRERLIARPAGFAPPNVDVIPNLPKIGQFFIKIGKRKIKVNAIFPAILVFVVFLSIFLYLSPLLANYSPNQVYVSLILTAGIGFSMYTYLQLSIVQLKQVRNEIQLTEGSFAAATFQMSSFLSQGMPAETTMVKVSETMKNTPVSDFFNITVNNIRQLGMSLKDALFDPTNGSTVMFPSPMIIASMRVFIESAEKTVRIAASAMLSISRHLSNLKRIDDEIKNLLDDVTSGMRVEVGLLSPVMAGIVVGMTTLIGSVLTSLSASISSISSSLGSSSSLGGANSAIPLAFGLFNLSGGAIPLYVFQLVIGIYLIMLSVIIGYSISNINFPNDRIDVRDKIASMLFMSMIIYILVAFITTFAFASLGSSVLSATQFI